MFRKIFNKIASELDTGAEVIEINYGKNLLIPVYGEHYAQDRGQSSAKKLYKDSGEKVQRFSLTPPCGFQIEAGWPEEPFLNVNTLGSLETTKENWLGYIAPPIIDEENDDEVHHERAKYIKKLIKIGKSNPIIMPGKVVKEGSEYQMLLFGSRKEIDEAAKELNKSS